MAHANAPEDHAHRLDVFGWLHVLRRTAAEIGRDNVLLLSAGVAFYTLLAIFPAMAALVALYGLFADRSDVAGEIHALRGALPPHVLNFVDDEITRLASAQKGGLSFSFIVGLLISLWSANGAVRSLIAGLDVAYEATESRGYLKLTLISFSFTLGALILLLIAVAAASAAPVAGMLANGGFAAAFAWFRWPFEALVFYGAIAALYRYGPDCAPSRWPWITIGGAAAAMGGVLASWGLSFYVANIANYGRTYGSLGAVVAFLMWVYVLTILVLAGAELNSERRRAQRED